MGKYRGKPIEAEQFWPEIRPWPESVYSDTVTSEDRRGKDVGNTGYFMDIADSRCDVYPGYWIITGLNGKKYPCLPKDFEKEYEKVP